MANQILNSVFLNPVCQFAGLFACLLCPPCLAVAWPQSDAKPGFSSLEPSQPRFVRSPTETSNKAIAQSEDTTDAGKEIDQLVTKLVLESIPHTFEETKNWGQQSERWDGVKFRREGFKIETNRRTKQVNHGTWNKYSARLLNPEEEFSIQVKNMRETVDEKIAFDVHFLAHLKIDGRQSKWVKGIQLYSFSIEGHTQVRLVVSIELGVAMDVSRFPPDMVFQPTTTKAKLMIDEFRIDRVSKAGGELAQQVSKSARATLDKKIAEKQDKLVEKINRQISKKPNKLRLSIADAMQSRWAKPAEVFLPKEVQSAMKQK